jgi:hypothetical protein
MTRHATITPAAVETRATLNGAVDRTRSSLHAKEES